MGGGGKQRGPNSGMNGPIHHIRKGVGGLAYRHGTAVYLSVPSPWHPLVSYFLCHPLPKKKNMLKRDSNESRTSGRKSGGEGVLLLHNVSPLSIPPPPPKSRDPPPFWV